MRLCKIEGSFNESEAISPRLNSWRNELYIYIYILFIGS